MKHGIVKSSTLARLGTWSARDVLRIKDEADRRGVNIDEDIQETEQVREDIKWIDKHAQKERRLKLP